MGSQWFRNYVGLGLTDEEFSDIPSPTMELTIHVTDKTFQAGCLLGTVFGTGAALAKQSTRNLPGVLSKVNKYGVRLAILGCFLGPTFTYLKVKNMEEDAIRDRCYRLRHNRGQVRVDQAANVGFVAGPLTALAMGHRGLQPVLTGMVLGVTTGVMSMAVVNNTQMSKK